MNKHFVLETYDALWEGILFDRDERFFYVVPVNLIDRKTGRTLTNMWNLKDNRGWRFSRHREYGDKVMIGGIII